MRAINVDNKILMKWNKTEKYYEGTTNNFILNTKIASFDLDGTLVIPKSNKKFAIDSSDWTWVYDCVPKKIQELYNDGYSIVIISNQAGISSGKQSGDEWINKLDEIVKQFGIEMKVLCSTGKNKYRKPITYIWEDFFPKNFDSESFYCGDAAGRKGDFSDTDYKFALNIGLKFYLPENLFLKKSDKPPEIKYCFDFKDKKMKKNTEFKLDFDFKNKEMLIMNGYPGSGKSFVSEYIKNKYEYEIINQDTFKTKAKCKKEAEKIMKNKKCLIIDATNPSKETRKEWIDLAKLHGFTIRSIIMTTSIDQAKHNNVYRSITKNMDQVPDIGYNMYKSKYQKPEISEGFEEILEVEQTYPNDDKYFLYLN